MTIEQAALLASALGLGAVLNSVVKAVTERRKLGADATGVLTAAALTLVEPLRKELEAEQAARAEDHRRHIAELKAEREQAALLKRDLDDALNECRTLRRGLSAAHGELTALRARLDG